MFYLRNKLLVSFDLLKISLKNFPGRMPNFKNNKVLLLPSHEPKNSVYRRFAEVCLPEDKIALRTIEVKAPKKKNRRTGSENNEKEGQTIKKT